MKIAFHGGKCCGIKTIWGFPQNPEDMQDAVEAVPVTGIHKYLDAPAPDRFGGSVSSDMNMFNREAPEETALERLDRLIAFLDDVRPNGIIEICLAESKKGNRPSPLYVYRQYTNWRKHLYKRGFRVVTHCHNSNSGNRVYVFHRKRDKTEEKA